MAHYSITLETPWLGLGLAIVLLPLVWLIGYRSLAALGPLRRWVVLFVRTLVVALFILALAEARMVRVGERLTVLYLLDQSESIPAERRRAMIDFVNAAIVKHRHNNDRAGVIVFGKEAAIEIPPFDENVQVLPNIESPVDGENTNIAAAMRLAQASFPEDSARRVVLISDGNENLGNAVEQAQALAAAGIGIDVVPVRCQRQGEVIVERIILPPDVRRGQPFDLKVVVTNTKQATAGDPGEASGRLKIKRRIDQESSEIINQVVKLPPGKHVFTVRQQLDSAGFFTYDAEFARDGREEGIARKSNRASAYTFLQGKGQVLLIEDYEHPGQYKGLIQALRKHNVEVRPMASDRLFGSLVELQQYDSIILADVPREHFTDAQILMLARNTQQMGAGLVMLGGENSFGPGGWSNSDVELAMPVDFHNKAKKVVPCGALAMIMHASEIPEGNFWQKKIAEEALEALGPRDYCGVIQYTGNGPFGGTDWLWKPGMAAVGENRGAMAARIDRMTPMDMPDFDPGLRAAAQGLAGCKDAAVKHAIVISDGDPASPSGSSLQALKDAKITVSTVAVGAHGPAESSRLKAIADATGGKYYQVNSANALPRIFEREARRVAQPMVYENPHGFRPTVRFPHEILNGIDEPFAPITGYVLTTRKESPLVEVSLIAPQPGTSEENRTILASWTYGLGKTVALTTDATSRWSAQWLGWENYAKLVSQMVRWSMRPSGDQGKFTVATAVQEGQVRVTINALDKNDELLNFLSMIGSVSDPNMGEIPLKIEQTAPGRYVGTFPASRAGSYLILVKPGANQAPLHTGINVPYSDEYRVLESNLPLLEQLARLAPEGGAEGKLIDTPQGFDRKDLLLEVNSFRHDLLKANSSQDIWYYLVLAASCLYFGDVFLRRVQVRFAWLPRVAGQLFGRKAASPAPPTIERLRSRKAEVTSQIEQLRSSARFEPPKEALGDISVIEPADEPGSERPAAAPPLAEEAAAETYTARLLKAKQKAWKKK